MKHDPRKLSRSIAGPPQALMHKRLPRAIRLRVKAWPASTNEGPSRATRILVAWEPVLLFIFAAGARETF